MNTTDSTTEGAQEGQDPKGSAPLEPLTTEQLLKFVDISKLFCQAERSLKAVETTSMDLATPVLNELRYAGAHLSRFFTGKIEDRDDELKSAENHCKRAEFDCYEVIVLKHLDDIRIFQEDFKNVRITGAWPSYLDDMTEVEKVKTYLNSVKKDSRRDYYNEIEPYRDMLASICLRLKPAREELHKIRDKELRDQRKSARFNLTIVALTVLTLAVAAFSGIYTYKSYIATQTNQQH